jgi:hypothetical protein
VAAAFVVVATAVMVRRFYPDRLVMQDAAHAPHAPTNEADPVEAPAA